MGLKSKIVLSYAVVGVILIIGGLTFFLLVRATTNQAPEDSRSESSEAERNKLWTGEWYWWFARGKGPVAFRHEAENGITAHALLSHFECPEGREEFRPAATLMRSPAMLQFSAMFTLLDQFSLAALRAGAD